MHENAGEIEKLKEALDIWAEKQSIYEHRDVAALFWPFVEFYLRTKANAKDGMYADDMKIMARFKKALGMQLMDWEKGMAQDE